MGLILSIGSSFFIKMYEVECNINICYAKALRNGEEHEISIR